jgi:catechol 2,3-dioxygenase-like lactoylglutathione lyase family enzyme
MLATNGTFSSFSATDIDAERAFYADTLGLDVTEEEGNLMLDLAGGHRVVIYPKDDHQPATFTVLNFEVDDIGAAVDGLVARGVAFQRYDGFGQDDRGIMRGMGPNIAWFTDPAGNILSLIQLDAST